MLVGGKMLCDRIEYVGTTHVGNVRDNNEDSYIMKVKPVDGNALFIVADGIGGGAHGDEASGMIVEDLDWYFSGDTSIDIETFKDEVSSINSKINTYYQNVKKTGGSTLTGVIVLQDKPFVINVGDSRVYRFRSDNIEQLTWDHTLENFQLKAGIVGSDTEVKGNGKALVRAMGREERITMDIKPVDLMKEDMLLVCSDGLYGEMTKEKMKLILDSNMNLVEMKNKMLDEVLSGDAKDNVTFIILKIN